jgi:hypothetical protein
LTNICTHKRRGNLKGRPRNRWEDNIKEKPDMTMGTAFVWLSIGLTGEFYRRENLKGRPRYRWEDNIKKKQDMTM